MATKAQCKSFKAAMLIEEGRYQGEFEDELMSYDKGFALKIIPETDYSTESGVNPLGVRWRGARMRHENYEEFLKSGKELVKYPDVGCNGEPTEIEAFANVTQVCDTNGTTVHMGYDTFGRCVKRTAIGSEIICILPIIETKAPGEYIERLRNHMLSQAAERLDRNLMDDMIKMSGFQMSTSKHYNPVAQLGYFSAKPQGVLSIGHLKRLKDTLIANNYAKNSGTATIGASVAMRVYASEDAINTAIYNRKRDKGFTIETKMNIDDPIFGSTAYYDGIEFVVIQFPQRGWLKPVGGNQFKFIEVLPTINRAGTGDGIVEDVNNDYYNCSTYCDGQKHELYEVSYIPHPDALERQQFRVPRIDKMFRSDGTEIDYSSLEVKFLDGPVLWGDCGNLIKNEDGNQAKMKAGHAYAPYSKYPEKSAVVLSLVAPECIEIYGNCCDEDECPPDEVEITLDDHPATQNCPDVCLDEDKISPLEPDCDNPDPDNTIGCLQFVTSAINLELDAEEVKIYVKRRLGDMGEATATVATTDGTAVAGTEFEATSEDLVWEDGCSTTMCVTIPITPSEENAGKCFTVDLTVAKGEDAVPVCVDGVTSVEICFVDVADCDGEKPCCGDAPAEEKEGDSKSK